MIIALDIFATGFALAMLVVALCFGTAILRGAYDAKNRPGVGK